MPRRSRPGFVSAETSSKTRCALTPSSRIISSSIDPNAASGLQIRDCARRCDGVAPARTGMRSLQSSCLSSRERGYQIAEFFLNGNAASLPVTPKGDITDAYRVRDKQDIAFFCSTAKRRPSRTFPFDNPIPTRFAAGRWQARFTAATGPVTPGPRFSSAMASRTSCDWRFYHRTRLIGLSSRMPPCVQCRAG